MPSSRRHFIGACIGGALGAGLLPRGGARPAAAEATPVASSRLSPDVALFTGAGGNVVVLAQDEGLLIVNGGLAERSAELMAQIAREFPGLTPRILFNTDWHPDHTSLNPTLGPAGTRIVAHENTKGWLSIEVVGRWQKRRFAPLPAKARPTETFYSTGTLTFGSQMVAYGHLGQAHTDGDIYVHLPGRDLLIAGDVVTVGQYPVLDYSTGGWIGGMTTAARTLVSLAGPATRVVPGTGPVQDIRHLQAEHEMLAASRDRLVKLLKSGASVDDMLAAAPTREFDAAWGDPTLFVRNAYQGLWWHARELGGVI
jgi:glyoxylase-like metal-dependent hydrolase (beta-lactamase superfamily II)